MDLIKFEGKEEMLCSHKRNFFYLQKYSLVQNYKL